MNLLSSAAQKPETSSRLGKPSLGKKSLLFLLGLSAAIVSLAQSLYVPLLPDLQQDLHTSFALVNLTVTAFTIALAVMQVVLGPFVDRSGRRKVLIAGLIFYILATIGCMFSGSIDMLLTFRVLQGIGAAAVPLVAATMIGDLFEGKERAESMATYQMILGLSPAIGPLVGGLIGQAAGYTGVFGFAAGSAVLILAASLFLLPETRPAAEPEAASDRRSGSLLFSFGRIFRSRLGLTVLLGGFVLYDVFYTLIVFLPTVLNSGYGLSASQIGFFSLLFMGFSLVGSKFSGKLQGKWGSAKALTLTGIILLASLLVFLAAAPVSLYFLSPALALVGLSSGLMMPVLPTLLAEAFVQERATAVGVYNFVRYLGMAAAPAAGSLLYPIGGLPLLIGFTAALVGIAVLFSFRRSAE